jgi:hypothetical protein
MNSKRVYICVLTGIIFSLAVVLMLPTTASASWHILLNDHFELPGSTWPWGSWHIQSANPSWGIEDTYWHVGIGTQACWIMGYPYQNGLDPEYDQYPANYLRWMYWGPFSLTNAQDAQVTFYLLNRTTSNYGDSCWWGAAISNPTSYSSYRQGGHHWGIMNEFQIQTYSLAELDSADTTTSYCGRPTVYIGWFFRSNSDQSRDMGAIIDDVILAWDDGMFDLRALYVTMTALDSGQLTFDPVAGDTILFEFQWSCSGDGDTDPFNMTGTLNDSVIYSERLTAHGETNYQTFSDPWIVEPGDWVMHWALDVDDEIVESSETNNTIHSDTLHVDVPNVHPTIVILTPPAGGAVADDSYLITWLDEDPDDDALIYLFYDTDTLGYSGTYINPGYTIHEDSPIDSLRWNTSTLLSGMRYWILARIDDPYSSYMVYSPGSVLINHQAVGPGDNSAIPTEFSLAPVYPNPFNATATLSYGVPHTAHVQLEIYNLLGQRVAELVNGEIPAGIHRMQWTPENLPSGVYLLRMHTPVFDQTQKMVLMK